MASGEPIVNSLYIYAPNKGAPLFFAIAYGISAVFHIWQCFHYKCFKLMWLHSVCAVLFALGYAFREYGAFNYIYHDSDETTLIIFVLGQVFVYICPPLLELNNYHVLGRVFYYVPHCAPFPPGRVLSTFGGLMVLVETLNALGVSLSSNSSSTSGKQALGGHLSIAALSMQLGVIAVFFYLAGLFHRKWSRTCAQSRIVKITLITLYVSMTLILVRCIYRLVEHSGNTSIDIFDLEALKRLSPVLRHEFYFYIFESTLMFLNSVLWNVWNPGRYLPKTYNIYLAQDGTQIEGEIDSDDRPLLTKTAHVLTFGIFFGRKRPSTHFYELTQYAAANQQ